MSAVAAPSPLSLLATDRRPGGWDVTDTVVTDRRGVGAVCAAPRPGLVRRAEPGPAGPLVLEARNDGADIVVEVWGPAATDREAREGALAAAAAWAGLADDVSSFGDLVAAHPVTCRLRRRLGDVRLSRMPRVGEAVGRAIVAQLVQVPEARRSTAQVAAAVGQQASGGLWCWPTARQLGAAPMWTLRRCGVSLQATRALHAVALAERRLETAASWQRLDVLLRDLPGVGPWTSGEARLARGDADAVPVGDWNVPAMIGTALTGRQRTRADWTDEEMLRLLEPFAGQRGRVIRLVGLGCATGLVPRQRRRAPRAALSAHRYW